MVPGSIFKLVHARPYSQTDLNPVCDLIVINVPCPAQRNRFCKCQIGAQRVCHYPVSKAEPADRPGGHLRKWCSLQYPQLCIHSGALSWLIEIFYTSTGSEVVQNLL